MRADRYGDDVSILCWVRKASVARSPPTTQLAMELPGGNARHDRPARNAKVVASGHGASPHLGGAGLMPVGYDGIADKILEFRTLQISWHHLALAKGRSAAELPISRQSSTQAIAAFRSSGSDR